jgi:hypothetical protein
MRVRIGDEVDVAGNRTVGVGRADVFHGTDLARNRLDHVGSADEHVRLSANHDQEIHEGGRIGRTTCARTGDHRNLGNQARSRDVVVEHLAVTGEGVHTFLDARATRVVNDDDGHARLHGVFHEVADLLRVHLAQAATGDGEVLADHGDRTAFHITHTGDDGVGRHVLARKTEVVGVVMDVCAEFLEGIGFEQILDAIAGGHDALGATRVQLVGAAAGEHLGATLGEFSQQCLVDSHAW